MKIQLEKLKNLFENNNFGESIYDPISIKKSPLEERELYKSYGITHKMDYLSFISLGEMFLLKYIVIEGMKDDSVKETKLKFPEYNLLKNGTNIEPYKVWTENIHRRNTKAPYLKLLNFLQTEVPTLNYHFYNMAFTKMNATNIEQWKDSFYLIEPYMKSFQIFKDKLIEICENIYYKYDLDYDMFFNNLTLMNNSNSKNIPFITVRKVIASAYRERLNVFWDKNKKKEERVEIKHSAYDYLFEMIGLINFHYVHYDNLHKRYNVSALKDIREKKEELQFSIFDEQENINYQQFYFEMLIYRSLSNTFDPLDFIDANVLTEHGVSLNQMKVKIIKMKYSHNLEFFKNTNGGSILYDNFDKNYRKILLQNKIEKLQIEKEKTSVKKKV